ncbi:hypothetical protein Bca52824_090759 [Brassica carinata]|uniref:Dihydroorotase n=1 Tax=Brassica carinata TaxID=52824 RepID=A0A8X7THH9_BRACI|nr:hypothetical protein Bca52824_090759 [Brassica carinata]
MQSMKILEAYVLSDGKWVVLHVCSASNFRRAIVMPNLRPPVTTTAAAITYRESIMKALPHGSSFDPLMTLDKTTHPDEIKLAPIVKAVTSGSKKFFLGTDSAPHERQRKESSCSCAGIFSAPVALSLYAKVFDEVSNNNSVLSRLGISLYVR